MPPITTGTTQPTKGLRLCREHARRLIDHSGPHAVQLDQSRT